MGWNAALGSGSAAAAAADLLWPRQCLGCQRDAVWWCADCEALVQAEAAAPLRVVPRVASTARAFALGHYGGPFRAAIIAAKERSFPVADVPLARAFGTGLRALMMAGELDFPVLRPLVLIPAPSSRTATRRRGRHMVKVWCQRAAAHLGAGSVTVLDLLHSQAGTPDSVGLSARRRWESRRQNIRVPPDGRVQGELRQLRSGGGKFSVVLVDDIVTTGATAAACVQALGAQGVEVTACVAAVHVR